MSVAFALRHEFPWRRVPVYIVAQVFGAVMACLVLWGLFGQTAHLGATLPHLGTGDLRAAAVEALLTFGPVSTILGTASGAQNVGSFSALAVGGYIALAGMWAGPVTGASMNPVRSLGPAVVTANFAHYWVYLAAPAVGMLAAVGIAFVLRGPGRDTTAIRAAQGILT